LRQLYDLLDGLLLPGGEDVDPALYGEARHEKCGPSSPELDEVELTLARWAVDDGKPVLAICRGIQVLNVALGGTLYQDIAAQIPGGAEHVKHRRGPRDFLAHTATITHGSRLALILGATSLPVNSLHHQAVKDVAPGLAVVAQTPDGIIEAMEVPEHPFAIGVQWHPEELVDVDARSQKLFDALVVACRR
jgi:putative glutamine amidotransferase